LQAAYKHLEKYFKNLDIMPLKILEKDLCGWDQFGFIPFTGSISQIGSEENAVGKAFQIISDGVICKKIDQILTY